MRRYQGSYSVDFLCGLSRVSRSGYYEWLKRGESLREQGNRKLLVWIQASYQESLQSYGAIRICRDLRRLGLFRFSGQFC